MDQKQTHQTALKFLQDVTLLIRRRGTIFLLLASGLLLTSEGSMSWRVPFVYVLLLAIFLEFICADTAANGLHAMPVWSLVEPFLWIFGLGMLPVLLLIAIAHVSGVGSTDIRALMYPFAHGLARQPQFRLLDNVPLLGFMGVVLYPLFAAILLTLSEQKPLGEAIETVVERINEKTVLLVMSISIAMALGWYVMMPIIWNLVWHWMLMAVALLLDIYVVGSVYVAARNVVRSARSGISDVFDC